MSVHISQFYSCSEVGLSAELFYIAELGKYLHENHGDQLSLDGVILKPVLRKSSAWDYFRMCAAKGYIADIGGYAAEVGITEKNPVNYSVTDVRNFLFQFESVPYDASEYEQRGRSDEYDYCNPRRMQVFLSGPGASDQWKFTMGGSCTEEEIANSKALNSVCGDKAWLSLVAMVAVMRLKNGSPSTFHIEFPYIVAKTQLALSMFMILHGETNAIRGWVSYGFENGISADLERQVGYEAWWQKGKEMGLVSKWYTPKDKIKYMKTILGIDVGDVVLLYDRNYCTKCNYVKSIAGFHFAIVRRITQTGITLEVSNTVRTRYGSEVVFRNQTMAVKEMYKGSDTYKRWNATMKTMDFVDLGVGYMMYSELAFIVPVYEADDVVALDVEDSYGRHGRYALPQNEAIYWILKDHGVSFNEEKFLSVGLGGRPSAYGEYMSGGNIIYGCSV